MLFGTDGIRGVVNIDINSSVAYNIGKGLAVYILENNLKKKVIVGKDTRLSSDCYVSSIISALTEYGINVDMVGIVATPVISFLVNRLKYSAGIMITASHNNSSYNGIKVFNQYGEKASKEMEDIIENNINKSYQKEPEGKIEVKEELVDIYYKYLYKKYINKISNNIKIVVDCANGSNYKIAPKIFRELGLEIIEKDCTNNGTKINQNCGANCIDNLIDSVKNNNANFGIAFDGDGDRLRVVCNNGRELNGDDLLYLFSQYIIKNSNLKINYIGGTIMTNRGLDKSLEKDKIKIIRSNVGDKNLIETMKNNCIILGGECSGHICFLNYIPSCDALYNALYFLKCYTHFDNNFEEIIKEKITLNSVIKNINVSESFRKKYDENIVFKNKIKNIENEYIGYYIIVRPSGTEPVMRIYVEGDDYIKVNEILHKISEIIKSEQI